jgi:hypothetical protein
VKSHCQQLDAKNFIVAMQARRAMGSWRGVASGRTAPPSARDERV